MLYSKHSYLQLDSYPSRAGQTPVQATNSGRYRRYMCRRMVVPSSLDRISVRSQTWFTSHNP
jgi:hypothetical protein